MHDTMLYTAQSVIINLAEHLIHIFGVWRPEHNSNIGKTNICSHPAYMVIALRFQHKHVNL